MQPQQIPDVLLSLLNVPDLVILAVVLVNLILGLRRGALASLAGLVGRCIAMAGSYFLARQLAPSAAKWLAEPIVRSVFEHKLKQSGVPDALADSVQTALCTAVQSMAESISYLVLIAVFSVLLSILISLAVGALRLLSRSHPSRHTRCTGRRRDRACDRSAARRARTARCTLVLSGDLYRAGISFTRTYRKYVPVS